MGIFLNGHDDLPAKPDRSSLTFRSRVTMLTAQCPHLWTPVRRGAVVRNGHRRKPGGIRSRAARVGGAALVLAGAALTVTGVAEAVSVPGVSPNQLVVPQSTSTSTDTATATDTPTGTPTDPGTGTATATSTATGGSAPATPPTGTATAAPSSAAPTSTGTSGGGAGTGAPTSAPASAPASAAATPPQGAPTAGITQPQPRQSLAETGTDQSVPWLLSGSATLIAGGALFRFGPRRTPRRTH